MPLLSSFQLPPRYPNISSSTSISSSSFKIIDEVQLALPVRTQVRDHPWIKAPSEERFFFFQKAAFSANSSSVRGGALSGFPVQCWSLGWLDFVQVSTAAVSL